MNGTNARPKRYTYKSLGDSQIRILHLQPGEPDDTIFIEISHEELNEDIANYDALSWEWGDELANVPIRIKDKDSTNTDVWTMQIKPNLAMALKHLRQKHKIKRLWVDAICIDQIEQGNEQSLEQSHTHVNTDEDKNLEKSHQISVMNKIYGLAEKVSVWLGEEKDDSAKAIQLIERLVQLKDFDNSAGWGKNTSDQSIGNKLGALIKLLKRGWFSRRWVVQEIALAQDATVHCGNRSISWTKVANAVALLEKLGRDGTVNRALKSLPTTNHDPEYIGNISSMPAYRLVQNTTGLFRGKGERGFKTWRYTLEELVSFLAAFKASRPHDTIYAILALASDFEPVHVASISKSTSDKTEFKPRDLRRIHTGTDWSWTMAPFEVDYEKPVLAVFKEFLYHAIKKSKSLDIICRPWAPTSGVNAKGEPEIIDLPSWIPALSRKPFQPTLGGNMVRYNPDPLVGPAIFRHKLYSASGSLGPTCSIDLDDQLSKCMTVTGFILDEIGEMWDSGHFGNVPADWLRAGHWENMDEVPPDELWRTLVADRNGPGYDPDRWYPLVFQAIVKERGISYGFETSRLIHESPNAQVAEVFRRVEAAVWNRRLIRTKGQFMPWFTKKNQEVPGALGLAPSETRRDDLICIIFGCSVPLVLRKIQPPDNHSDLPPIANGGTYSELERPDAGNEDSSLLNDSSEAANSNDNELYTLVGECYVDHMMDGEAIAYYNEKIKLSRKFTLL